MFGAATKDDPSVPGLAGTKKTGSLISVEYHPAGRSVEFIKLLLAGAELQVSTGRAAEGGGKDRGRVVLPLSCQGTETRLDLGSCYH